jgi:sigma-B regulation protein RsbU (phosphoserine phosphatase)
MTERQDLRRELGALRREASAQRRESAALRRQLSDLERAAAATSDELAELRGRVDRELATAHRIQLSLLPRSFPAPSGWDVAARYRAAREIGGDLYDVYPAREGGSGGLGLSIADVTGKGVTAALLMAFCRAIMRTAAWNGHGPSDTLTRVNRVLARDVRSGLFVTALVVELAADGREVRWSSAGHEPPLLVRPRGSIVELPAGGIMLGLFDNTPFPEHRRTLEPGETFLMLTDGVTDAEDRRRRRFGDARLRRELGRLRGEAVDDMLGALVSRIDAFAGGVAQADDLAIVALRRTA